MRGLSAIARVARELREDVSAARDRDPAARAAGTAEILLTYPGVHAILAHRISHALHQADVPLLPRLLSNASRIVTGIEIHPAARIGNDFFVDHGSGVVVGETAEIGDRVTLFQGVTLGGTGFATGKRHPTVEDNVTIGSGAKLLGPITVGHGAKVGARGTPCASRVAGRRGRTPTGCTCRTRSPMPCTGWRSASASWSGWSRT